MTELQSHSSAFNLSTAKKSEETIRKTTLDMQTLVREQVFTKIMDNYIYPAELGVKHFWCMDCGDKFIFKSSYDFHVNRCSLKITVYCRVCKLHIQFTNRCKVLSHIRSHVHQLTTLNLSDIHVQPLPEYLAKLGDFDGDLDLPLIDVQQYLDILKKNSDLSTEKESSAKTIDSLLKNLENSFDEAYKFLENTFKDSSEIENISNDSRNTVENIVDNYLDDDTENINDDILNGSNSDIVFQNDCDVSNLAEKHNIKTSSTRIKGQKTINCRFCSITFPQKFSSLKVARFAHFQNKTLGVSINYTCYICMLILPNNCAYKAHKMIHVKTPPFVCPECGNESTSLTAFYVHLSYFCFHFARCLISKCFVPSCTAIVKNDVLYDHYLQRHTKLIFKCLQCPIACFTVEAIKLHTNRLHKSEFLNGDSFYQCLPCSGKVIFKLNITRHFSGHMLDSNIQYVYSCPGCHVTYQVHSFFKKHITKCSLYSLSKYSKVCSTDFFFNNHHFNNHPSTEKTEKLERTFRNLQKSCMSCKKSFMYSVRKTEEFILPSKCPVCKTKNDVDFRMKKTLSNNDINSSEIKSFRNQASSEHKYKDNSGSVLVVSKDTPEMFIVTEHIQADFNKEIVNPKDLHSESSTRQHQITGSDLHQMEIESESTVIGPKKTKKRRKAKRKSSEEVSAFSAGITIAEPSDSDHFSCAVCSFSSLDKTLFREHIVSHRDISSAYQCMECGLCFVVKTSLSSHLFISHGIINTDNYFSTNECFDKNIVQEDGNSLFKCVNENQCQICLEQFENSIDHDKHFRVHGMAFILKKQRTTKSSDPI